MLMDKYRIIFGFSDFNQGRGTSNLQRLNDLLKAHKYFEFSE